MGSILTIMSTTSVDADTPIYEIWENELPICEIGLSNQNITVNFCEGLGSREIGLEDLLIKLKIVLNKLNDYQNRVKGLHNLRN